MSLIDVEKELGKNYRSQGKLSLIQLEKNILFITKGYFQNGKPIRKKNMEYLSFDINIK